MFYCLINDSYLNNGSMKFNYSIINDLEEIKINKSFDIDMNHDNLTYIKFSQDQLKKNILDNYINEIEYDFNRSRYIFGKNEFRDYFYEIDQFKKVDENFNFKYMKISDIIVGLNHLNINL